ncbi:hypothetical protein D3C75_921510 [compost metagenome]
MDCRTIGVAWEEGVVGIWATTTATIQVNAPQRLNVDTKTYGAFGEARQVVELEALTAFFLVDTAFAVVVVEVHGARAERQFAVFNETRSACLLGENPQCHGQGQAGLVHVLLLYVLILVYLWRWDLLPRSPWIGDLVPKRDRLVNRF